MNQFAYLELECKVLKRRDLAGLVHHCVPGAIIMPGHKYLFNEFKEGRQLELHFLL